MAGLNWMSFGARQYDPQIGRFLSVDPMASAGGQDMLSPYHAMGNNPVSGTDPGGTITGPGQPGGPPSFPTPYIPELASASLLSVGGPPGGLWQVAIDGPPMGFSASDLNDVAGNINTDPMDLEGLMSGGNALAAFIMAVKQAGGIVSIITGNQPLSQQIVTNLTMGEGNGSGGGASDDAGGDPPKGDEKGKGGDPQSGGSSTTDKMLDKSGKVSTSLDLVSFSSYISGAPKFGELAGRLGTGVGLVSLGYEGYNVYNGKGSTSRFVYHLSGFAAAMAVDLTLGAESGSTFGPYGAAAGAGVGLTFGAAEIYYDNVVVPYIAKPFNSSFNSFMRSYFNIPSF